VTVFPENIQVGSLVRTIHNSILWNEGDFGIVLELCYDKGLLWSIVVRLMVQRSDGRLVQIGPHSIEVLS
jgi:hypothetical protein